MLLLSLLACNSTPEGVSLTGDIALDDIDEQGEIAVLSAYGLAQDGKLIAYLSSAPDVSCADMVAHLTPGDNTDDPTTVFDDNHCNLFMSLPDWDDGFAATDDPLALAGFSITCPLGEGEFVFEERDTGDTDFYWSGPYWQGHPQSYDIAITPSEDGYEMTMDMTDYTGHLIYESLEDYDATGITTGEMAIVECAEFAALHEIY